MHPLRQDAGERHSCFLPDDNLCRDGLKFRSNPNVSGNVYGFFFCIFNSSESQYKGIPLR
jgi:hypothetical protein